MKRKFLEDLGLTKEQIDSVMAENGADIEAEKAKTTEVNNKLENADKQLKEANSTIESLKKSNFNNEELQTKVNEYENTIKTQKADYESKVKNLTFDSAIEKALVKAKAKYPELLSSKIDKSKLLIAADGVVSGIDEQVKTLTESFADMFIASGGTGSVPGKSNGFGGSSSSLGASLGKQRAEQSKQTESIDNFFK